MAWLGLAIRVLDIFVSVNLASVLVVSFARDIFLLSL